MILHNDISAKSVWRALKNFIVCLVLTGLVCVHITAQSTEFKSHPSISVGYGQPYLSCCLQGDAYTVAVDVPISRLKFIAFEVTDSRLHKEHKIYDVQGNLHGGYKYTYRQSDLRFKYGFNVWQSNFLELKTGPVAMLYYERAAYLPYMPTGFPISGEMLGIGIGGELRCMFVIEDAVRFFAGTQYTAFRVYHATTRRDNPSLLKKERTTESYDVALFDDRVYWFVGLNLRLW